MMGARRTIQGSNLPGPDSPPDSAAEVGVVLMDQNLQPIAIDRGAQSILGAFSDARGLGQSGPHRAWDLPAELVEMMRRSDPAHLSSMTVRFAAAEHLYTGRAFHVAAQNGSSARPAFIVHLQREAAATDSLLRVCEEYRLTAREREALSGIATGMTSKELAERMNIRPSTVKAFLRVMMIKMGVSNRAGVVAKLLTTSAPSQELPAARPKRTATAGD